MSTPEIARRIIAHLSPMVGPRASAPGTVTAPAPLLIEAGELLYPVRDGQLDGTSPWRVKANVTAGVAPVAVQLESMVGGIVSNIPNGTVLRWADSIAVNPVTTTALATGGADRAGLSLRQIVYYESVTKQAASDMFAAKVSLLPAAILVWDGSGGIARVGPRRIMQRERWNLFVCVSRMDGSTQRGADGLRLLDEIERRLVATCGYGLNVFSSKETEIISRGRLVAAPTSYVYSLSFGTFRAVDRLDDREPVITGADMANITMQTDTTPSFDVVKDVKVAFPLPHDEDPSP